MVLGPFDPTLEWIIGLLLIPAAIAVILSQCFQQVGLRTGESAVLLIGGPLASAWLLPWGYPDGGAVILANIAGIVLPVGVATSLLVTHRAPWGKSACAVAVTAIAAYLSSVMVPNEGILLSFRLPAVVAAGAGIVFARTDWSKAGAMAFVAGTAGVILGADLARLPSLLAAAPNQRVVLGGAGIFDGIFLVGLLSVLLVLGARLLWDFWGNRIARKATEPRTVPPSGYGLA
ncbi:MAG: DUF1614 domain-containing protein [Thermoplasmatota archaeon]